MKTTSIRRNGLERGRLTQGCPATLPGWRERRRSGGTSECMRLLLQVMGGAAFGVEIEAGCEPIAVAVVVEPCGFLPPDLTATFAPCYLRSRGADSRGRGRG